ncbi:MAG: hypothetical protein JW942_04160 [Opitutales bacterium]|nr:hypothetical protein [Opitutales bacterium]
MDIDKSLFIRSNRTLGQSLVQAGLLSQNHLDEANAQLIDCVRAGNLRAQGLLPILTHQMKVLSEDSLLQYQATEHGLGLMDLHSYTARQPVGTDPAACWATWTLPIDEREGIHFLASAYYTSQHARTYWEQLLGANIVWYAASQQVLIEGIEKLESLTLG